MHTTISIRRRLGALGLALIVGGVVAAPAHAAPEWMGGTIENSVVRNCNSDPESGILANAEFYADPQNLPRIGDVFYVRTIPARVGNGCGVNMTVHVEVVPPPGVSVAVSPETPVRCTWLPFEGEAARPAEGCPQHSSPGLHGLAFDQVASDGGSNPWAIPHGAALSVEIPLRSNRRLAGPATQLPSCGRRQGDPPCRPDQAGDHLQFANWVTDGNFNPWLSPYVPLSVQDGTAGTGPSAGGTGLIASAPRSIRAGRLRRGVPVGVRVDQPSSRVIATLSLRRRVVARGEVARAPAGTQAVRLRPTAAGKRSLRRLKRSARAVLTVVVKRPAGGGSTTAKRNVTLRR